MEEKIRINLSKKIIETLTNDMESFGFTKKDGTLNKNAFFNQLIVNYSETYMEYQQHMLDKIQQQLDSLSLSVKTKREFSYQMLHSISNVETMDKDKKESFIAIRPTSKSSSTIDYIEYHELNGISRSAYYRNMFESYISHPIDQRERVIFKDFVDTFEKAIKEQKRVSILSKSRKELGQPPVTFDPYALAHTREEMFNYLIMQRSDNKQSYTIRLANICHITVLPKEAIDINPKCLTFLERMEKHDPQYHYTLNEGEPIKVRLTEDGKLKFNRFYIFRPEPVSIDGDIYTFECSETQLMSYFSRFGKDATILSPARFAQKMYHFHKEAKDTYYKQYEQSQKRKS